MARAIEIVSLFLLILLVGLRPLVAESYDSAPVALTAALGDLTEPLPARTLVFDAVVLLATCGWLVARAIGPTRRYRRTGLELGLLVLGVAAILSCCAAGNKRLAIIASIDWLCHPLLAIALVQLLRRAGRRRLLLSVVLASACAQAIQCIDQYVSAQETRAHYLDMKSAGFWERQGVEPGSPKIELFERRMNARDAQGFFGHAAVAGSYLVLCGFAALAVVIDRWRERRASGRRWPAFLAAIGVVLLLAAAVLTHSRGALAAGAVALGVWSLGLGAARRLRIKRTRAFALGCSLAIGGTAAVVAHGLYHGSLPGASLGFRWKYWQASAQLIADHPITGVGRENFGRHYPLYKSIQSPEEIANPHNLFVQFAAEWGIPGLAGGVILLFGAAAALAGIGIGENPGARAPPGQPSPQFGGRRGGGDLGEPARSNRNPVAATLLGALLLGIGVIGARIPLLGSSDSAYVYYSTMLIGTAWAVGFALFGFAGSSTSGGAGASSVKTHSSLVVGIAMGLLAFVLHDMISFATFVPGAAATAFALFGLAIAERSYRSPDVERPQEVSPQKRWALPIVAVAATAAVVVFVLVPVGAASSHLNRARRVGGVIPGVRAVDQPAVRHYQAAADADPLDPTPCAMRAAFLLGVASSPDCADPDEALESAIAAADQAILRDRFNAAHYHLRSRLQIALAGRSGDTADYERAIHSARSALALYPRNPDGLIRLADTLRVAGIAARSPSWLREAADTYRAALDLDQVRPEWEIIRRFSPDKRNALVQRLEDTARRARECSQ